MYIMIDNTDTITIYDHITIRIKKNALDQFIFKLII